MKERMFKVNIQNHQKEIIKINQKASTPSEAGSLALFKYRNKTRDEYAFVKSIKEIEGK